MPGVWSGPLFLGLILFPRSERVKMDPRSIDTFGGSFPAVLSLESCGFDAEKCGCFEGPNKVVHFSGIVLDLTSPQAQSHPRQQARSAAAAGRAPQSPKEAGAKRRGRRRDQGPQQPRAPTSAQRPQPTTAPSQAVRNNVTAGGAGLSFQNTPQTSVAPCPRLRRSRTRRHTWSRTF